MHRSRFWTLGILAIALTLTLALVASSAFAAQNVGNTSQKGSLLVFPYIDVGHGTKTLVQISNAHQSQTVRVQCVWMNEYKVLVNFAFDLSAKGTIIIDAKSGDAEAKGVTAVNPFPNEEGPFGGFSFNSDKGQPDRNEGELVCWAVNGGSIQQINFNHLSGNASVIRVECREKEAEVTSDSDDSCEGGVDVSAFQYSSWAFTARSGTIGTPFGTAGTLVLDGLTNYDACPQALILDYAPDDSKLRLRGTEIEFGSTKLGISSCTQDLREVLDQSPTFNVTRLSLNSWNSNEVKFSGAFECADSTWIFKLQRDVDFDPNDSFSGRTLDSKTAFVKVAPTNDSRCSNGGDYNVIVPGIVGVARTEIDVEVHREDGTAWLGTNLVGQGAVAGQILWSPGESEPEAQ